MKAISSRHPALFFLPVILLAAGLVATGLSTGMIGATLAFVSFTFLPGYCLLHFIKERELRLDLAVVGSFVVGLAIFGVFGYVGFFLKLSLDLFIYLFLVITVIGFIVVLFRNISFKVETGDGDDRFALKFILSLTAISMLLAMLTGSFRGWFEAWDYYSYIAMVLRFVSRGVVDNFPLAYANETPDPIHGYNIWALMWACISRVGKMEPVMLYIKSGFLVAPLAIIAFYSMSKSLLKNSTHAACTTALYFGYHVFYAGQAFLLRSTFYNADPAWLICLPTAIAFAVKYFRDGEMKALLLSLICALATFMVHPFWGGMFLITMIAFTIASSIKDSLKIIGKEKYVLIAAFALFALQYIPFVGLIIKYFKTSDAFLILYWPILDRICSMGLGLNERHGALILFFIIPSIMAGYVFIKGRISFAPETKRMIKALVLFLPAIIVIALPRMKLAKSSSELIYMETSPYKSFVSDRLYVLNPFNLTFTAPDMTLYPLGIIGVLLAVIFIALFIFTRGRESSDSAGGGSWVFKTSAVALIMPLVALSPVFAPPFSSFFTVALLRRSLRLAALFGIMVLGYTLVRLLSRFISSKRAIVYVVLAVSVTASYAASYMPVRPEYFRHLNSKMAFVAGNLPRNNLVWHWDMEARDLPVGKAWVNDGFIDQLKKLPPGETVFSDRFTSYRLPAYADVYVVARLKPGSSVIDQSERERDQALFFQHGAPLTLRTMILDKYNARYIIISMDLDYRLVLPVEDYGLGDPYVARELDAYPDTFKLVYSTPPWRMYRYERSAAR